MAEAEELSSRLGQPDQRHGRSQKGVWANSDGLSGAVLPREAIGLFFFMRG